MPTCKGGGNGYIAIFPGEILLYSHYPLPLIRKEERYSHFSGGKMARGEMALEHRNSDLQQKVYFFLIFTNLRPHGHYM
jgi:hypothetical protein